MFEKLVEVLASLVKELKRYNDRRDATAPSDVAAPPEKTVSKPAPEKAAPVKTVAAKPAAKATPKGPSLAEGQDLALKFVAAKGDSGRTELVALLKDLGVPGATLENGKTVYRISNIQDDAELLASVIDALKNGIGAEDDPTA